MANKIEEAKKKLEGMPIADAFKYLKTMANEDLVKLSAEMPEKFHEDMAKYAAKNTKGK